VSSLSQKQWVAENSFAAHLICGNRLDSLVFEEFVFYPGMLFATKNKWWGKPGRRHASHEGIDLCFFRTKDCGFGRLDDSIRIPMAEDSRIVRIMDDFLGQTVVVACEPPDAGGRLFYTLYAHIRPHKGLAEGDRVARGEMFAKIAPVAEKGPPLLPHLHVSMAWADQLPDCREWQWKLLNQYGSSCFLDPLQWMVLPRQILPFSFEMDLFSKFTPCRRLFATPSH